MFAGTLQPGQLLQDRYRVLGILGEGGMGAVYQSRDMRFAEVLRFCAVKEMINLARDPDLREMAIRSFEREAEILATLSHPAIPQIYDYFNYGDCAYLVQEFIQGRDLEALMKAASGFLPTGKVVDWAIDLCDVLTYLHNHQPEPIIFRDMKPSNVMIDHLEKVRLIDFGIARAFQPNERGTMVGTQGYAPPELYEGLADARTDVYSLGATMHHLLTGVDPQAKRPFSFEERPIASFNPAVGEALAAVVMRAVSLDPNARYQTAHDMKQALIAVRTGAAVPHTIQPTSGNGKATAMLGNGHKPTAQVESTVDPLWVFSVEGAIRSTPIVHHGTIYFGSNDNNLWALSTADGSLKWKFPTHAPIVASPVVSGREIITGSLDGSLYAVDIVTGKPVWQVVTGGEIHTAPTAALGLVLVGSEDGKLLAVKPDADGARKVWEFNAMSPLRSSPVIYNERIYVGRDSGELICLDMAGRELWRFTGARGALSDITISGGVMFAGSKDGCFYALDTEHPHIHWSFQSRGQVTTGAAVAGDAVFFGSRAGYCHALDASSGRERWKFQTGSPVVAAPAALGDSVYVGTKNGVIVSLHARTGRVQWQFQTHGPITASPWLAEGRVLAGSEDHSLYALPG